MAGFFSICDKENVTDLQELILRRYNNIDYILSLPIAEAVLFAQKAIEKDREEKHFAMWVAILPWMSEDTYISFEDYSRRLDGKDIDKRSPEEILQECKEIAKKAGEAGWH